MTKVGTKFGHQAEATVNSSIQTNRAELLSLDTLVKTFPLKLGTAS